ncbi:GNAT family N-acetyltransferase [Tenacibaculum sp.]|uniref:GNAT family N-acetyltransferase n=1 Tax=Tenacibaculum sp. TaxID=1906242 RepID=UPI003D149A73
MKIRKLTINDLESLQNISIQTFSETFSSENSTENITNYLENSFSTKRLRAELNDLNSHFYFAEIDNQVCGYLKINIGKAQTEIQNENALEIERIYVLKEFQGMKVGQVLFEKATKIAKEKHVDFIWLGVWENNHKAIQFYRKNGFVAFDKHVFRLGNDEQTDIMMKLKIN